MEAEFLKALDLLWLVGTIAVTSVIMGLCAPKDENDE